MVNLRRLEQVRPPAKSARRGKRVIVVSAAVVIVAAVVVAGVVVAEDAAAVDRSSTHAERSADEVPERTRRLL